MATANLVNEAYDLDTGNDSIVIVRNLDAIRGGRTLDVSGVPAGVPVLKAGHIIIANAAGNYAPLPIASADYAAYGALPAGYSYVGVLIASLLVSKPFAGILTQGTVNPVASPIAPPAAAVTALTNIQFRAD